MESPKAGIVIKENSLYDNSNSASSMSKKEAHSDVMSVMMANITAEAAMEEMERKINFLMKVVEERDHEITALREQMCTRETVESNQTPVVKATDKGKNMVQENQPQQQSVSVASLSVQQLQDIIVISIRAQYGGPLQTSFMYSKSYTKRIDNLRMPLGIKRRPTSQAVHSKLKRKCFRVAFRQHDGVNKYQTAKGRASHRLHKPMKSFKPGLQRQAHRTVCSKDVHPSIANRGAKDFLVQRTISDKNEINDTKKIANNVLNESMVVQETPLKSFSKRKETKYQRNHDGDEKQRLTLRERQKKVYPFPNSDVANMLEQLIEKKFIQLPECKRPKQAEKVDDPNYCKYHRVISHPVEKCFVLKELVLMLARKNKIKFDIDEVAQTNHVVVNMTSSVPPSILLYDQRESLIQFGNFEHILVLFQKKIMTSNSQNKEKPIEDEGKE
ncbi:retrotransposon gag protein [Cucumis melo var. makuwa]|uniref:Retrotransposon gag protein n=1 Tax=Cucumis melo var. makuwa TaxID=1194695 RepID=A0A5A7T6I8_CUCMM|nr:retrotransposon gag protein [Cucumis melo var. makuwa]TYJ96000.1 retrotransposon gag protein [Cucumis melo var. makuwa]